MTNEWTWDIKILWIASCGSRFLGNNTQHPVCKNTIVFLSQLFILLVMIL